MERTARARTSRGPLTHLGELSSSLLRKRKEKKKKRKKRREEKKKRKGMGGQNENTLWQYLGKEQTGGERREGKRGRRFRRVLEINL